MPSFELKTTPPQKIPLPLDVARSQGLLFLLPHYMSSYSSNLLFPVTLQSSPWHQGSVMIAALKHETKQQRLPAWWRMGRGATETASPSMCCVEIKRSQAEPWNRRLGKKMLREHSLMRFMINILKVWVMRGVEELAGGAREISAVRWSANKKSLQGD